jgi:hypothetical protein
MDFLCQLVIDEHKITCTPNTIFDPLHIKNTYLITSLERAIQTTLKGYWLSFDKIKLSYQLEKDLKAYHRKHGKTWGITSHRFATYGDFSDDLLLRIHNECKAQNSEHMAKGGKYPLWNPVRKAITKKNELQISSKIYGAPWEDIPWPQRPRIVKSNPINLSTNQFVMKTGHNWYTDDHWYLKGQITMVKPLELGFDLPDNL